MAAGQRSGPPTEQIYPATPTTSTQAGSSAPTLFTTYTNQLPLIPNTHQNHPPNPAKQATPGLKNPIQSRSLSFSRHRSRPKTSKSPSPLGIYPSLSTPQHHQPIQTRNCHGSPIESCTRRSMRTRRLGRLIRMNGRWLCRWKKCMRMGRGGCRCSLLG